MTRLDWAVVGDRAVLVTVAIVLILYITGVIQ